MLKGKFKSVICVVIKDSFISLNTHNVQEFQY